MLNAFGSNLLWKRRLSAFFCTQNFWSRTFLGEIMAENVPKNDLNQAFWWGTHSKLGHEWIEWPKIRQTVDLGHLKPILYQPRGGFTPNWGHMSEFSQKNSELGFKVCCPAHVRRVPTWTHKRPVWLYQANLCSVVRAHGTLLGPPGVLVPDLSPFVKFQKSVSRMGLQIWGRPPLKIHKIGMQWTRDINSVPKEPANGVEQHKKHI